MTGRLTKLVFGAVFAGFAATSAHARPVRAFERAELFATCAGKLSALATHQNGYGEGNVAATRALVRSFEDLLEAILPDAYAAGVPESEPGKWRSQGWSEIAALLSQSHFGFDDARAERSMRALNQRIAACAAVVLPSGSGMEHLTRGSTPMR